MANDFTYTQISAILNGLHEQVTGVKNIAPIPAYQFTTVGQSILKQGYDPLLNAISVILTRTIFSIRPYTAKFRGMEVSKQRFGAITRKLNILDSEWEDDQSIDLIDGGSVDMYKIRKPKVLQMNFYGQNVFQKHYSIFKNQLDLAFEGPAQLAEFWSMVTQNVNDLIEQQRESMRRMTLGNLMAGTYLSRPNDVVHLVSEYNTAAGLALTPAEVLQPVNFKPFIQWAFARVEQISKLMTERSKLFHTVLTGKEKMMRHTPQSKQKVYLYNPYKSMVETMVMADTYHNNFLKLTDNESVNFWQSIETPNELQIEPVYLAQTGELVQGAATTIDNIFGVIFDEEAAGITTVNEWSAPTPLNAAGGYWNIFFHFTMRYWNDFTENCVMLMMD